MHQSGSPVTICVQSQVPAPRAHGWRIAALVLASVGWISSFSAQAGCSRSVTTKADAARFRIAHLDRLVLGTASSEESLRNFPLNVPSPPPCSGFRCSGNSIPPTPMGIPQTVPRIDAWNRSTFAQSPCEQTSRPSYSMMTRRVPEIEPIVSLALHADAVTASTVTRRAIATLVLC